MRRCPGIFSLFGSAILLTSFLLVNCTHKPANTNAMQPLPDINQVLERHQSELMSISNVVGVYVGLLPDDKTPCLRVMLEREDLAARKLIPARLEGYPVLPEVTGPIRPLGETNR